MRHARDARAGALVRAGLAALLAQAVLQPPAVANGGPRISGSMGHTFAILGTVREGAPAFELRALVPVDGESGMLGLGVGAWGADMGQTVERLIDPVTLADVGMVGGASRFLAGGGLAGELHLRSASANGAHEVRGGPFLTGTAGVYYVESRRESSLEHTDNALGWSVATGWRFRMGALGSLGPGVHYTRVFDDRVGRFMTAGLDWTWR
jgi:hypothetical protein